MRWKALLFVVVLATVAVGAADVFTEYGLAKDMWELRLSNAVVAARFEAPPIPAALKALPPAQRVSVINALGAFAKAYVASDVFKAQYKREYENAMGHPPTPPGTTDPQFAAAMAQSDKAMEQMKEQLESMPPEMQAMMKQALEAQAKGKAEAQKEAVQSKAKYEKDLAAYQARQKAPGAMPQDPQAGVKLALKEFLDATAGVDYNAPTVTKYGQKRFASDALEAKPAEWKMCFRAGRETCDAARSFAQAWMAEIK
jgi:hypothetical protein